MLKRLFFLLLILLLTSCSLPLRSQPTAAPTSPTGIKTGSFTAQLTSSGETRSYILHVPPSYQPGTPTALVFNFHGFGSDARQQQSLSGMSEKADQAGFIVLYPEGLDRRWATRPGDDPQPDIQFVRDLIAAVSSQYSIDPRRIYATGLSNGGGMSNRLACDLADVIAAIAPDSGAYYGYRDCKPSRPVPVLAFHGLEDHIVPYDGNPADALPPIRDWAQAWADRDGCSQNPAETSPVATVTLSTWSGCQGGAVVELYSLQNHGHSWPGSSVMPRAITSQAINATDLIWEFFQAHPLP